MSWQPVTEQDKETLAKIHADPYYWTVFKIESDENPLVASKISSAKGAFQLIKATRDAEHVTKPFNLTQNFNGFVALTDENKRRFGSDPERLYSAHFLGATLLARVIGGQQINHEDRKIVDEYKKDIRPRFNKTYAETLEQVNANGRT